MSCEELRVECQKRGLPTKGGEEVLRARLEAYQIGMMQRKRPLDVASPQLRGLLESRIKEKDVLEEADRLLEGGADPNVPDAEGVTALHLVAAHGTIYLAEMLKRYGANLSVCDSHGATPLHHAVGHRNWALVHWLIERGANVEALDHNKENILFYIVKDKENAHNENALACFAKYLSRVSDCLNNNSYTLLHYACMLSDSRYADLILKTKGVSRVNQRNCLGKTALMFAAENREIGPSLIRLLLVHRARKDITDKDGSNALVYAFQTGTVENMQALEMDLLEQQFCLNGFIPDEEHPDPLGQLRFGRLYGVMTGDVKENFIAYMKDDDADPRVAWALLRFVSPMWVPDILNQPRQLLTNMKKKNPRMWRFLLPQLSLHQETISGYTMLHHAVETADMSILECALQQGINPFLRTTEKDFTALDMACAIEGVDQKIKASMVARLEAYQTFCFTRQHAQWYGPYFVMRAYAFMLVLQRWKTEGLRFVPRDVTLCILRWLANFEAK